MWGPYQWSTPRLGDTGLPCHGWMGVWSDNFTSAFFISFSVTVFVPDIEGIRDEVICLWTGTTCSVNVTSTCSDNSYDISCRQPSRKAPNLKKPRTPKTKIRLCPSLKQRMKKIIIVWVVFGSKLLSSFLMSAIYSFVKYLLCRQTKARSSYVENTHSGLDRLGATHFLTLRHHCLCFDPYFGNHCARSTSPSLC